MKNKRLIILLSVFAFLALVAVLCSTVFTVRTVQVEWATTKVNFVNSDDDVVSQVKRGGSVFLLDKTAIADTLEGMFPYLKVEGLEIKFPNKLVVHASERQEVFEIKTRDNVHYVLDGECKVLRVSNDASLNGAVSVTVTNYAFSDNSFNVSHSADIGFVGNVLDCLAKELRLSGKEGVDIKNNISSVKIDVSGHNETLELKMRGVTVKVNKITSGLSDKIRLAISAFETGLTTTEKEGGVLTVYESGGKTMAEYDERVIGSM